MSGAVIFLVRAVQEHGIFAGGGFVQVIRHNIFQHNGVQLGEKAWGYTKDLCSDENRLLGDPSWAHFGMYILRA